MDNTIHALLIDPFKEALINVHILPAFDARWRHLLDCTYIDCVRCQFPSGEHALWVDEACFLREPLVYPQFKIAGVNSDRPLAGYGLLTGLNPGAGQEILSCRLPGPELAQLVQFESWQKRLKAEDYLDQLTRLYLPWP
jgi:hypothetical protein